MVIQICAIFEREVEQTTRGT